MSADDLTPLSTNQIDKRREFWVAPRNEEGRKKLRRRIIAQLNAQVDAEWAPLEARFVENQKRLSDADHVRMLEYLKHYHSSEQKMRRALEEYFRQGHPEPLREAVREYDLKLASLITRPPKRRWRGDHFEKNKPEWGGDLGLRLQAADQDVQRIEPSDRLRAAIADAGRIRDIRREYVDGKRNGPIGGMTAEEIAAERWDLTANEILKKRLSRRKRKKKPEAE